MGPSQYLCHLRLPVQGRHVGTLRHWASQIITKDDFNVIRPLSRLPFPLLCPGAVDEEGHMPFYAEECASMLAVTFSGGDKMLRSIVSASWALYYLPLSHKTSVRRHNHLSLCSLPPYPVPQLLLPEQICVSKGMPFLEESS